MSEKPEQTEGEKAGFQTRMILVMADEMRVMKESIERNCIMFAALAASVGINVQF